MSFCSTRCAKSIAFSSFSCERCWTGHCIFFFFLRVFVLMSEMYRNVVLSLSKNVKNTIDIGKSMDIIYKILNKYNYIYIFVWIYSDGITTSRFPSTTRLDPLCEGQVPRGPTGTPLRSSRGRSEAKVFPSGTQRNVPELSGKVT